MILITPEIILGATAAGVFSANTNDISGILGELLIQPTTGTTVFDVSVINNKGLIIYKRTSNTGDLAEELRIPLRGIYTVLIDNATADEAFIIQLMIQNQ